MKKLFFLMSMALIAMVEPSLANRPAERCFFDFYKQRDRTKIKKEELPESVRKTLEGDAFKGWVVEGAYKTKGGEYEVDVKKGDTVQTVKFDKDGKLK